MKRQMTVTVEGEAMVGKSSVAALIEDELRHRGIEVRNEDDAAASRSRGSIMHLMEQSTVVIKTRLTPKPGKKGAGPLTDEECLTKLKEVRDYVNGLTEFAGQTRAHGEALATIDEVADEIEDRLAAQQSLGGTGA